MLDRTLDTGNVHPCRHQQLPSLDRIVLSVLVRNDQVTAELCMGLKIILHAEESAIFDSQSSENKEKLQGRHSIGGRLFINVVTDSH